MLFASKVAQKAVAVPPSSTIVAQLTVRCGAIYIDSTVPLLVEIHGY